MFAKIISFLSPYWRLGRLHSLWGANLILLPTFMSLALNGGNYNFSTLIYYYIVFAIASIVIRASGVALNDVFDRNIDSKVERTKNRPIANKTLSVKQGLIFVAIMGFIALTILLTFNTFAIIVGLLSVIIIIVYPLSKRFFHAPQLILGFAMNYGVLVVDATLNNTISNGTIILYIALIFWTLAYDTIYAYQDYEYDKKLSIYSLTKVLKQKRAFFISLFYIIMFVCFVVLGIYKNFYFMYYVLLLFLMFAVFSSLYKLNYNNAQECFRFFKLNTLFGLAIFLLLLIFVTSRFYYA